MELNIDCNSKKIFAFFGTDIEGYSDNFLNNIVTEHYTILALDSRAIESASKSKVPYTIINDWISPNELMEIQDIAWDCEVNWFRNKKEDFLISGICWPELDHKAMSFFWLDSILSLKLSEKFYNNNVRELLLINQNVGSPVIYHLFGSICKTIWESELKDRVKFLESKKNDFQNNSVFNIPPHIKQLLFSPVSFLKNKIAFFASDIELRRSHDLLLDLTSSFQEQVIIIPNEINDLDLISTMSRYSIPVLEPYRPDSDDGISGKLLNGYHSLIKRSTGNEWDKILTTLPFHFEYYCNKRWPKLINEFHYYIDIFSRFPPKLVIGALLDRIEWSIPILSAQVLGIKSISIPHSVSVNSTKKVIDSDLIFRYDYHLYLNKFSKEILTKNRSLSPEKFIPCQNCTDINSHYTRCISPNYPNNVLKILVLFSPTSLYIYPTSASRHIFPHKNPRKQIESIIDLEEIAKKYINELSIKFKLHPGFSELELFQSLNNEILSHILPLDAELKPILNETDLVIGVNYYGSALIQVLEHKIPFIEYINDKLFMNTMEYNRYEFEILKKGIYIIHSKEELIKMIQKILTNIDSINEIKTKLSTFSEYYFENKNYQTISSVINNLLKNDLERLTENR